MNKKAIRVAILEYEDINTQQRKTTKFALLRIRGKYTWFADGEETWIAPSRTIHGAEEAIVNAVSTYNKNLKATWLK